jgi:FKBP-type peptidyl-prolyl cis-trans isomerase
MKKLNKREWIAIGTSIVVVAILFFGGDIWNFLFNKPESTTYSFAEEGALNSEQQLINISNMAGIEIYDLKTGTGAEAVAGKIVSAHYIGTLEDGTKFDSSIDRGKPFEFVLGSGQVIKGWDIGIAGMKVGGVRKLVIAPELAYGSRAIGPIPPNSTLTFEVQLVDVK